MSGNRETFLTEREVHEYIFEQTSFKVPFEVKTGEKLEFNSSGLVVKRTVSEDGEDYLEEVIDYLDYVIIEFNQAVYDRVIKTLNLITRSRGLLRGDELQPNHPYVRELKQKMFPRTEITQEQLEAVMMSVAEQMQPYYALAFYQVICFVMMANDFFYLDTTYNRQGAKRYNDKFNVQVPEDYWLGTRTKIIDDDEQQDNGAWLDEIIQDHQVVKVNIVKNSVTEQMIARITAFLNDNEQIMNAMQPYINAAFGAITMRMEDNRYDSFRDVDLRLDEFLVGELRQTNYIE